MKGSIVPEAKRAAIYNLYRIPLNFIVLFSLLTDLTAQRSFVLNALMLGACCGLQAYLTLKRKDIVAATSSSSPSAADKSSSLHETEPFLGKDDTV